MNSSDLDIIITDNKSCPRLDLHRHFDYASFTRSSSFKSIRSCIDWKPM